MDEIQIFHTTNIILADTSKFSFIGSIPESMLRDVTAASDVLQNYRTLPVSGFLPMTREFQKILDKADKPKKGGKKRVAKVSPSEPTQSPKKGSKRKSNVHNAKQT